MSERDVEALFWAIVGAGGWLFAAHFAFQQPRLVIGRLPSYVYGVAWIGIALVVKARLGSTPGWHFSLLDFVLIVLGCGLFTALGYLWDKIANTEGQLKRLQRENDNEHTT